MTVCAPLVKVRYAFFAEVPELPSTTGSSAGMVKVRSGEKLLVSSNQREGEYVRDASRKTCALHSPGGGGSENVAP